MGQAAVGEPEVLVEPPRIGHQRVTLPFSDGSPVIQRVVVVSADLALMATAVKEDDPVVGVPTPQQHKNALAFAIFYKLHTFGQLELARTPWRLAVDVGRVVSQEPLLPLAVERQSPR